MGLPSWAAQITNAPSKRNARASQRPPRGGLPFYLTRPSCEAPHRCATPRGTAPAGAHRATTVPAAASRTVIGRMSAHGFFLRHLPPTNHSRESRA